MDYSIPLYQNYEISKKHFIEHGFQKNIFATINTAIKHMNSLNNIDETLYQLDDALSKSRIPQGIKVYRAIKMDKNTTLDVLNSRYSNNAGYISTSPLYDSSFAKYDDYDTVIELLVPRGSKGVFITPLSDYDTVEQEILFAPANIYYTDIQHGVIDKNGKSKTIVKAVLVSKDVELQKSKRQKISKNELRER